MASKVMVKIPVAPFGQVNKSKSGAINGELVTVTTSSRSQDVNGSKSPERPFDRSIDGARVAQLEQNIRFLQEQHQLMLTGLHNEIESLRNRNRELQFQLVFVKGTLPSSPSSPEDDTKHKVYSSPKQINITPLQVEILEKELGELKSQFQELDSRNVYLSAIVDEQKKKLERYERDREKERERAAITQHEQPDHPELLSRRIDEAEVLIRRLRQENSDLRRENSTTMSNFQPRETTATAAPSGGGGSYAKENHPRNNGGGGGNQSRGVGGGGGGGGGRHRSNNGSHHNNRGNWFPPVHSQNYWQQGSGNRSDRSTNNSSDTTTSSSTTPLPHLHNEGRNGGSNGESSSTISAQNNAQQQFHHRNNRGSTNNHNNNYHNSDGRKYRGGQHKSTKPS